MERIVTTLPEDSFGVARLLPDYRVETIFERESEARTRVEFRHYYSIRGWKARLFHWIAGRRIAKESQATLNAIKHAMEEQARKALPESSDSVTTGRAMDLNQYVLFGGGQADLPDGPMLACLACVDLATRPPVDDVFEQVAAHVRSTERDQGGEPGKRIAYTVLIFGYEYLEAPLEDIHATYNRMWARHPDLWEAIQKRDLPATLWMVDVAGTPYFGIIQPALGFDSEVLSARNIRDTDRFRTYMELADKGDFRRAIAIFGVMELSVTKALNRMRSQRRRSAGDV
jgi:hypothetical protein